MNILTFDIEEWYTYELYPKGGRNYYLPIIYEYLIQILDLLDEINTKATFFCLGKVAISYPNIINRIIERGHEIGCHSNNHQLITQMTPLSFKEDTHQAIDSLEQVVGKKIEFYRAPAFSITKDTQWALEVLFDEGIKCDSSILPFKGRYGGFPSLKITEPSLIEFDGNLLKELPISCYNIFSKEILFSGGGYFRLFPYWMIKKMINHSEYNITYFHIRDFDKKQKRVLSKNYFFSYYGINSAFTNFKKLIKEFEFISIGSAIKQINWQEVPKVVLKM